VVSGKVELFDGVAQMVHPDHVLPPEEAGRSPFEPVYPLTAGITQKTMFKAMADALARVPELPEWIDPELKRAEGLAGLARWRWQRRMRPRGRRSDGVRPGAGAAGL
jgi:ATP-dependent DNA helicase RecG